MNDVRKRLTEIEDRLQTIRNEIRYRLISSDAENDLAGLKHAVLEVFEVAGRAMVHLGEAYQALDAEAKPSYAEPSPPAGTIHRHAGFFCSGLCCPKPSLHDGLASRIEAIKVVRNTNISPAYEYGGTEPKTRLGLKDCKHIIDALDDAGMLRVR